MKSAIISGTVGCVLSWFVGTHFAGLSEFDVVRSIAAANVSGLVSLLITLWAERIPALKRGLLSRGYKTWALIATLYLSMMVTLVPALRDPQALALLFLPNVLTTGFAILVFGPIQDALVHKAQRRARRTQ